jgi:drug/metabolite transporter (DMT)-like permease
MKRFRYPSSGFLLVALGAALWGTDALFRRSLALELPASTVVFWEHLILVLMTLPLLIKFLRNMPSLDRWDVTAILFMGAGASAIATILFTQAFTYGDPTTPLLIQKLQPVIVILAAYLLLSERLLPRYGLYFGLAVGGAYLISFSDPTDIGIDEIAPALLAGGAAILWAMGTVVGRHLTAKIAPSQLTSIRFAVGLPTAAIILVVQGEGAAAMSIESSDIAALFVLALVPGLAALVVYYKGLSRTYASSATLAELAFPLTAILIGWSVFDAVPTATQWLGIVILTATIAVMSLAARDDPQALGVRSLDTASEPERSKSAAQHR